MLIKLEVLIKTFFYTISDATKCLFSQPIINEGVYHSLSTFRPIIEVHC